MMPRLHSLGESLRRRARLLDRHRRFNCQDQDRASWDERAAAAAELLGSFPVEVDNGALQIADLGCGNERLRRFLAERLDQPFDYFGYDLQPQSDRVERLDIRKAMPARVFDAVFCLGLLEYVAKPDLVAHRLSKVCRIAIVSYVVADSPGSLPASERRKRGWRTNLAKAELESIFAAGGFVQKGFVALEGGATGLWLWAAGDPWSLDHR
jgi:SAM-dependent methyltransferase